MAQRVVRISFDLRRDILRDTCVSFTGVQEVIILVY